MTTDNFCYYLQHRLIQTGQTGGQLYSYTSPFRVTCYSPSLFLLSVHVLLNRMSEHLEYVILEIVILPNVILNIVILTNVILLNHILKIIIFALCHFA
jgi:hypothetical protein